MNKNAKKSEKVKRPFALEFLESIPEAELKGVAAALGGGFQTQWVSIWPRPDHG